MAPSIATKILLFGYTNCLKNKGYNLLCSVTESLVCVLSLLSHKNESSLNRVIPSLLSCGNIHSCDSRTATYILMTHYYHFQIPSQKYTFLGATSMAPSIATNILLFGYTFQLNDKGYNFWCSDGCMCSLLTEPHSVDSVAEKFIPVTQGQRHTFSWLTIAYRWSMDFSMTKSWDFWKAML